MSSRDKPLTVAYFTKYSKMTVVSLYARVSSKKQAQEDTIGSQLADLESRIDKDVYELLN